MNKQELRQLYKSKRTGIQDRERLRMDDLQLLQFQQFDYASIQNLLSFWPMAKQAEPNTHLFSAYLRHMIPDLQISYPMIQTNQSEMTAIAVSEETLYHTNSWGITEPREGTVLHPESIDLIFVPMLVCDKKGYRVGYGKGYYDRYLAQCREDIVKIGFSYFDPIEEISDTDHFDVPLTYCITPRQTYEF